MLGSELLEQHNLLWRWLSFDDTEIPWPQIDVWFANDHITQAYVTAPWRVVTIVASAATRLEPGLYRSELRHERRNRGLLGLDRDFRADLVNHRVIVADFHPIGTPVTVEMPTIGKRRATDTVELMLAMRAGDDTAMQPVVIRVLVCHGYPFLSVARQFVGFDPLS
jgi:hypothetical protein